MKQDQLFLRNFCFYNEWRVFTDFCFSRSCWLALFPEDKLLAEAIIFFFKWGMKLDPSASHNATLLFLTFLNFKFLLRGNEILCVPKLVRRCHDCVSAPGPSLYDSPKISHERAEFSWRWKIFEYNLQIWAATRGGRVESCHCWHQTWPPISTPPWINENLKGCFAVLRKHVAGTTSLQMPNSRC